MGNNTLHLTISRVLNEWLLVKHLRLESASPQKTREEMTTQKIYCFPEKGKDRYVVTSLSEQRKTTISTPLIEDIEKR